MRMKAVRVRSGTTRMRPPDPELIHRYAHCRSSVLVSLLCRCRCYTNWRCPSIHPSDFPVCGGQSSRRAHTTTTNSRRPVRTGSSSSSSGSSSALLCSSRSSTSACRCAFLLCHALAAVEFVLIQLDRWDDGLGVVRRSGQAGWMDGRRQVWAQDTSGTNER